MAEMTPDLTARLREQVGRVNAALLREDSHHSATLFAAASGLSIAAAALLQAHEEPAAFTHAAYRRGADLADLRGLTLRLETLFTTVCELLTLITELKEGLAASAPAAPTDEISSEAIAAWREGKLPGQSAAAAQESTEIECGICGYVARTPTIGIHETVTANPATQVSNAAGNDPSVPNGGDSGQLDENAKESRAHASGWRFRAVSAPAAQEPCTCLPPEYAYQKHEEDCPRRTISVAPAPRAASPDRDLVIRLDRWISAPDTPVGVMSILRECRAALARVQTGEK